MKSARTVDGHLTDESSKPPARANVHDTSRAKGTAKPEAPVLTSTAPTERASVIDGAPKPVRPLPRRVTKDPDEARDSTKTDSVRDVGEALDPGQVHLERFVLSSDVEGREPVDVRDVFTTDDPKIFAFLHFDNGEGEPYAVKVHFEPAEGPALPYGIGLEVGASPRWRTWAYTRLRREPGTYRAVVRTPDGQDIASRTFEVVAAE